MTKNDQQLDTYRIIFVLQPDNNEIEFSRQIYETVFCFICKNSPDFCGNEPRASGVHPSLPRFSGNAVGIFC